MHEIQVKAPAGRGAEIAALAGEVGIDEVSVSKIHVYGPNQDRDLVTVSVSTPTAKRFIDALFTHEAFNAETWSVTSRELRAIFSSQQVREITCPMPEPALDVFEDLWQLSYVTPSYVARVLGAAVLLAYGMLENKPIPILVAALFLPFLSIVLALSFGLWSGDRGLAWQGALALLVSIAGSVAAGVFAAIVHGPPMEYNDFEKPLLSFGFCAVIGAAAGLSISDDTGRRYLIGVAAAVQYAIYPVWFGISLVLGFPAAKITAVRLFTLLINIVTIAVVAAIAYGLIGMHRDEVRRFVHSKTWRAR